MKILIEEHSYEKEQVDGLVPEGKLLLTNGKYKVENVGYYRGTMPGREDFIFFLPKVLLEKDGRVFKIPGDPKLANGFKPEEIIDPDAVMADGRQLTVEQRNFLCEFAVWIYRALAHYEETHGESEAVWRQKSEESGGYRRRYETATLLDVILAMRRFARDNRDYFLFKIQEKHSGVNKINWRRTMSKSTALLCHGRPLYLDPVNKKKTIDFDEELLVIFYSILKYVNEKFHFSVSIPVGYNLISAGEFDRYLVGYGTSRLRQIKYKYYSDRDLQLWALCFAFFDKAHKANAVSSAEEYLLAKDFNIVFEAMVDELLGDPELRDYKTMKDKKEIDHLFVDDSVILNPELHRKTLYIADSKYYRIGSALDKKSESVYKQFSYARRMLQLNMNLFLNGDDATDDIKVERRPFQQLGLGLLRDDLTEGYGLVPNFFISANMPEYRFGYDYDKHGVQHRRHDECGEFRNIHFENRLFDRDTLILMHYDINFLYVLKRYALADESVNGRHRREIREIFKNDIRALLGGSDPEEGGSFKFYALMPHEGVDAGDFFRENFKETVGRVSAPFSSREDEPPIFVLALQKPNYELDDDYLTEEGKSKRRERIERENENLVALLDDSFYRVACKLGEDPRPALKQLAHDHPVVHSSGSASGGSVQVVSKVRGPLTKAVDKCGYCPCPVDQCADPHLVSTLVLPFTQGAHLYSVVSLISETPVDRASLDRLTHDAFREVVFPTDQCWVWQVKPEV